MPTIDQRILIAAPPDIIWAYLSDIRKNPEWQTDCKSLSILSQTHEGIGTRWRSEQAKNHAVVIQITAWYNGLGYEYTYIDGTSYKQNLGRIRLQETAEGTVVQWTFNFEGGGLGQRGAARKIETTMANSLRELHKQLHAYKKRTLEPKSLMQDDPGVEARSTYKPRYPSAIENSEGFKSDTQPKSPISLSYEPPITDDDNQHIPTLNQLTQDEPPVAVDDTRPRVATAPPVIVDTPSFEVPTSAPLRDPSPPDVPFDEPEFLADLEYNKQFAPPTTLKSTDTQPVRSVKQEEVAQPIESHAAETYDDTIGDELHEPITATVETYPIEKIPVEIPVIEPVESLESIEEPEPSATFISSAPAEIAPQDEAPVIEPPQPVEPITPVTNASGASIWEVFGIKRPSDSEEIQPVAIPEVPEENVFEFSSQRIGLKIRLRNRRIKLRRPQI